MNCRFRLWVALWSCGASMALADGAPAILEKARSYLGSEAALNQVEAVRYEGVLTSTETSGEGETRTVEARIEIAFQKPFRQRIVARGAEKLEVTALDDYEGWQYVEDPTESGPPRLTLLGREQVKRLRANTWENLSFYRVLENGQGEIVDHGEVELDGRRAHRLSFHHGTDIVFTRSFDVETGRLMRTETGRGDRIEEDGEMVVGGIRFPERVVTNASLPDGGHRTVTVVFERVRVNEPLPEDKFRVPMIGTRPTP